MKKLSLFIISFCFMTLIIAQESHKSWGNINISASNSFNGVHLKYDWLRENMSIKISDDGFNFIIGGDDIEVEYKADMSDGTFKLQKVNSGMAYINQSIKKTHSTNGVKIKGRDMEALQNLANDFTSLIYDSYKVDESFKAGFKDDNYNTGKGVELYGNGNAYAGFFENGERHGKGNYVFGGQYVLSGTFKNGAQNGFFDYKNIDGTIGKGKYVNGVAEGTWVYTLNDGSTLKKYFINGVETDNPEEQPTEEMIQMGIILKKIIADIPNELSSYVIESEKYKGLYKFSLDKMPYFNRNPYAKRDPNLKTTMVQFQNIDPFGISPLFADVPKLVKVIENVLDNKYVRCFNKECNNLDRPYGIFSSQMKEPNLVYIWKAKSDKETKIGEQGTIMLHYNEKDNEIMVNIQAMLK